MDLEDAAHGNVAMASPAAPDDGVAMNEDPFMDMEVDSHPHDMSIRHRHGLSKAEKKRIKNEAKAAKRMEEKLQRKKVAEQEALAREMNKALDDLGVMHLDKDPFVYMEIDSQPPSIRHDLSRAERQEERQRIRDLYNAEEEATREAKAQATAEAKAARKIENNRNRKGQTR